MNRMKTFAATIVPARKVNVAVRPKLSATSPPRSGPMEEPSACAPKRTPMLVPPMLLGVVSRSHACSTGRIAYRKKPRTATKNTNASDLPASAMKTSTTAVIAMLVIITLLRPMRSDRWPAMGAAAKPAVAEQPGQAAEILAQGLRPRFARGLAFLPAELHRSEENENEERDHNSGNDVQDHHFAPGKHCEQRPHDDGRDGVADVPAHSVQREDEALAVRETARERGNRRRMPQAVAEPDERHATQKHQVAVREAHQEIWKTHPEERGSHQHALASDGVDEHSAGDVCDGACDVLAGHDQADLAVGKAQFLPDDGQDQIESRRIPVRERVAERDQPHLAVRAARGFGDGSGDAHFASPRRDVISSRRPSARCPRRASSICPFRRASGSDRSAGSSRS